MKVAAVLTVLAVAAAPALAEVDYTLTCNTAMYHGTDPQGYFSDIYKVVCVKGSHCEGFSTPAPAPNDPAHWVGQCQGCAEDLSPYQVGGYCTMKKN
ncbi:hypothetical protein E4U55_004420 [Claviceps digitariae]|nr:hypothetical protein E4U55_004420 [Claviceps digitariae]